MRVIRITSVTAYACVAVLGSCDCGFVPHVVWTLALPLLPLSFLLFGFARWRRACPIAAFGELGARATRVRGARMPRWLARYPMCAAMLLLTAALAARHASLNGSAVAVGGAFIALAAAAIAVNARWGGRAFCNSVCPVGFVERLYTDGLPARGTSRCAPCTGCKKRCPDAHFERAFAADALSGERRWASFAFPGVVSGFYGYFYLRGGTWAAYFDGSWTRAEAVHGFHFAPGVPVWAAASLTLLACAAISLLAFALIERVLANKSNARVARTRCLALASLAAFLTFYAFAGAPGLGAVPGLREAVVALAFALSLGAFVTRWRRAGRAHAGSARARAPEPRHLPVLQTGS